MSEREPITAELRRVMNHTTMAGVPLVEIGEYEFGHRCDAIDAVHAALERENAELRERVAVLDNERVNMHDGGSITGELRKWAKGSTLSSWTAEHLTAIADRIDAEHQKALDEWKAKHGQMWLKGYSECHAELLEGNETLASDLEGCGWIRLPKDADGEYTQVGDVMEWPTTHETFEVVGIGDGTLFYIEDGSEQADWTGASTKRHHHAPTVKDVLTEFGIDWEYETNCEDRAALLAEYAAKLRLAGDAE